MISLYFSLNNLPSCCHLRTDPLHEAKLHLQLPDLCRPLRIPAGEHELVARADARQSEEIFHVLRNLKILLLRELPPTKGHTWEDDRGTGITRLSAGLRVSSTVELQYYVVVVVVVPRILKFLNRGKSHLIS